jgi:hypothetical protein
MHVRVARQKRTERIMIPAIIGAAVLLVLIVGAVGLVAFDELHIQG